MTVKLKRRYEIGEFQIGVLTIEDTFFCYTIESIDNKSLNMTFTFIDQLGNEVVGRYEGPYFNEE